MLIDNLVRTYRELTGAVETIQPLVTVPVNRPAANANRFVNTEMQARRHRRQRRLGRSAQYGVSGWSVRAW